MLLVLLYHRLDDPEHKALNSSFSQRFGKKSFNLDVSECKECMEALLNKKHFDAIDQPESVANILARYHDIGEKLSQLPEDLQGKAVPFP